MATPLTESLHGPSKAIFSEGIDALDGDGASQSTLKNLMQIVGLLLAAILPCSAIFVLSPDRRRIIFVLFCLGLLLLSVSAVLFH
jgi:hypothetical protein